MRWASVCADETVSRSAHKQLVTNDYKFPRLLQLFLAVKMGFAVVLIDGRGSSNRGLEFESHLKYATCH